MAPEFTEENFQSIEMIFYVYRYIIRTITIIHYLYETIYSYFADLSYTHPYKL